MSKGFGFHPGNNDEVILYCIDFEMLQAINQEGHLFVRHLMRISVKSLGETVAQKRRKEKKNKNTRKLLGTLSNENTMFPWPKDPSSIHFLPLCAAGAGAYPSCPSERRGTPWKLQACRRAKTNGQTTVHSYFHT